jgi:hypothetical protein
MAGKWKNSSIDQLPGHRARVFIAVRGVCYRAQFDAVEQQFLIEFESLHVAIPALTPHLYWTETDREEL